jgi:hypothetical protein
MGKNRKKAHRISEDVLLRIAQQVCNLAGVSLEHCWVHGSQSPGSKNWPKKSSDVDLSLVVNNPQTIGPWGGRIRPGRGKIPRMISLQIENRTVEVSVTDQKNFPFFNSPRVVNLGQLASDGD